MKKDEICVVEGEYSRRNEKIAIIVKNGAEKRVVKSIKLNNIDYLLCEENNKSGLDYSIYRLEESKLCYIEDMAELEEVYNCFSEI